MDSAVQWVPRGPVLPLERCCVGASFKRRMIAVAWSVHDKLSLGHSSLYATFVMVLIAFATWFAAVTLVGYNKREFDTPCV